MTPPHNIALNQEFDLELNGDDLVVRDSTEQHQRLLLLAQPGNLRWAPTIGVGLQDYLAGEEMAGLLNKVRQQFQKDGMRVQRVGFNQDITLTIDAHYA